MSLAAFATNPEPFSAQVDDDRAAKPLTLCVRDVQVELFDHDALVVKGATRKSGALRIPDEKRDALKAGGTWTIPLEVTPASRC